MAQRFTLTIIPTGGSKVKQAASADEMITSINLAGTKVRTFDAGGYNIDNSERIGECRKAPGYTVWNGTSSATGAGTWQNYLMLDDGTNVTPTGIFRGKFWTFSNAGVVTNVDAGTGTNAVTFSTANPISMIQYGAYAVFGDVATTPYKWKYGDANTTKLILSGTEFKFKYLEKFNNHVIGAYSDQANGNIDIRWTDALPTFASLDFPAANQLYKPDTDIGITGLKTMGNLYCLVYGRNSIHNLAYDADGSVLFSAKPLASNIGTDSHFSIVDVGDSHLFFDRNKGFIRFAGPSNWAVISDDITVWLDAITRAERDRIFGCYIENKNEVCWAIPTGNVIYPNWLLYYNLTTKEWRREQKSVCAMTFADYSVYQGMTWTQLSLISPNSPKWPSSGTWEYWLGGYTGNTLFGGATGYSYWMAGNDYAGSDYGGWRVEPVFSYPDSSKSKRVQELWFGFPEAGAFSVDVLWRTGETEQECMAKEWESIGSVSCASSAASAALFLDKTAKFHQMKWGTDLKNEPFAVSEIIMKGIAY